MICNLPSFCVPEELMMLNFLVVEQINKNEFVSYKTASDEGVWEIVNWHRMIVQPKSLVDIELIFFNFFKSSSLSAKGSQVEFSIVKIGSSEDITFFALLNFIHLDIADFFNSTVTFFKGHFHAFHIKHMDPVLPVVLLRDRNC
jgi:hypothetical protein